MNTGFEDTQQGIAKTETWLRNFVIEHELCPFARRELDAQRVRFTLTQTSSAEQLLHCLADEFDRLLQEPGIATTLLIHPCVLLDFSEYNAFLDVADSLLQEMQLEGTFQIASFHPQYCFADAEENDPANYTNRSPFPLLHLLREEDVTRAVDTHPDVDGIPERNITYLRALPTHILRDHSFS